MILIENIEFLRVFSLFAGWGSSGEGGKGDRVNAIPRRALTRPIPPKVGSTDLENLQILPLGNVRLFRRIRKNDTPCLKQCVCFAEFTEIIFFRRN